MKYLFLSLIFFGCCCPRDAITRVDTIVRVDTVQVMIPAETVFDTVHVTDGQGESIRYIVKVDTLFKTVFIKGKERIVKVPQIDTLIRIKEVEKYRAPWYESFGNKVLMGLGLVAVIALIVLLIKLEK